MNSVSRNSRDDGEYGEIFVRSVENSACTGTEPERRLRAVLCPLRRSLGRYSRRSRSSAWIAAHRSEPSSPKGERRPARRPVGSSGAARRSSVVSIDRDPTVTRRRWYPIGSAGRPRRAPSDAWWSAVRPSRVSPVSSPMCQNAKSAATPRTVRTVGLPGPIATTGGSALSDRLDLLETLDRFALVPDRQAETLEDGCLGFEGVSTIRPMWS